MKQFAGAFHHLHYLQPQGLRYVPEQFDTPITSSPSTKDHAHYVQILSDEVIPTKSSISTPRSWPPLLKLYHQARVRGLNLFGATSH
jgi:formyltetrahydrofolate hydrolase